MTATILPGGAAFLRTISQQDFQAFGNGFIGYIRPVIMNNRQFYSLHAADGQVLGVHESANVALVTARQNGVEPLPLQ